MENLNCNNEIILKSLKKFESIYGSSEHTNITVAPASLILLGDHTHYNEGILLSAAVNRVWVVVLRKRKDRIINYAFESSDKYLSTSFDSFEQIDCNEFNLLRRLTKILYDLDYIKFGFDCVIASDVPDCLGLGSLAGMQVAFLINIKKVFSINTEASEMIDLLKKNEAPILGKITNQAHHFTAYEAKDNKLFSYDLRTKLSQHINFFTKPMNIVICDTEDKIISPQERCNERVEECEIGVKGLRLYIWGIKNLRDIESDFLMRHYHMLPKRIFNRVLYNVNERKRAESAIRFLRKGMIEDFGVLLTESHWGLSKDFEISSEKSDFIVEEAVKLPGVIGSKMISCSPIKSVYNIIEERFTDNFINQISKLYSSKYNSELKFHILKITHGIKTINYKELTSMSN